jgi:SAM-dependent methyltransferase
MKPKYRHTADSTSDQSPAAVVPLLLNLLKPGSVVDVGCGIGNWMQEFKNRGVPEVFGIDGLHLDKSLFIHDPVHLVLLDLEKPFRLERRFDVAISLEVAEHLDEAAAKGFVESLCALSDTVVFSAAVPGQGGQNHKNEQWPSYWRKKFENNGHRFYDIIRPAIWDNGSVKFYYKQNMFIASRRQLAVTEGERIIDFMHPDLLTTKLSEALRGEFGVKIALKTFLSSVRLAAKSRVS